MQNSPYGKVLKRYFDIQLFLLTIIKSLLKIYFLSMNFLLNPSLNKAVNSLCCHPALVISDHQRRAGLPRGGAELSQNISSADSAGRVVGIGGMFQRNSSPEFSLRVCTFSYMHGVMPLLKEFPVEFFIVGGMRCNIVQWWRFGPARMDCCIRCGRVVRG